MRKTSYLNAVLTVIAVLLGLNLLVKVSDSGWPAAAQAQQPPTTVLTPPFNSAEDRKVLISLMENVNQRLTSIEAKMDKGFNVVVTKMPPVTIQGGDKRDSDRREPNADTKIEVKREPQK